MIYETHKSRLVELSEKHRSMILTPDWLLAEPYAISTHGAKGQHKQARAAESYHSCLFQAI